MDRQQAIWLIKDHMEHHKIGEYPHILLGEALNMAIAALSPQNEPLTLEQLREMDGEPVWVVVSQNWRESGIKSGWRLVKFHINDDRIRLYMFDTHFGASFFAEQDMGRSYWVYRRPPEGEA